MHSINCRKLITLAVLFSFLLGVGCATTESYKPPVRSKTEAYTIELEDISYEPYNTVAVKKGDPAPADGILFDTKSAKRALETEVAYRGLRAEVEIQNDIATARAAQLDLLLEANDLQKAANVELIREIERNKKWNKVEKWGSFFGGILLMVGSKYVWN